MQMFDINISEMKQNVGRKEIEEIKEIEEDSTMTGSQRE